MDFRGLDNSFPTLKHFRFGHLPLHLQPISRPFCELALSVAEHGRPDDPETRTALRKLLEAKDCAVRAALGTTHAAEGCWCAFCARLRGED